MSRARERVSNGHHRSSGLMRTRMQGNHVSATPTGRSAVTLMGSSTHQGGQDESRPCFLVP
jgi:hypothetical protein